MIIDILIDYHSHEHGTAKVTGLTTAGSSLVRSNAGGSGTAELKTDLAEAFGAFAERRGLCVDRINMGGKK
jgi:hypothetical protein